MTRPLGVILAGGLSRRMGGGDKALSLLNGTSLMARVVARIGPQVGALAINANGDAARFSEFGLPVIADSVEGFAGPLAGVLAGLDWAASQGAADIVTVAADTPFFPSDLVMRLRADLGKDDTRISMAATPDAQRGLARQPTFALWPVALREDLRAALSDGVRKVVVWADKHGCAVTEFEIGEIDPFFNVNTPEDMDKAARFLSEGLV